MSQPAPLRRRRLALLLAAMPLSTIAVSPVFANPLGTRFTFQGTLLDAGAIPSGTYDFEVALYDVPSGGFPLTLVPTYEDVAVAEGLFQLELDFSWQWWGESRWLELRVRDGGSTGAFETLSPRQELTATPYALYALSSNWDALLNVPAGFEDGTDDDTLQSLPCAAAETPVFDGAAWTCATYGGGGGGAGWSLTGNAGTVPGVHFLGTTDGAPFEIRVENLPALRIEPVNGGLGPHFNVLAGTFTVASGAVGVTISGGGLPPLPQTVHSNYSTLGGGYGNLAGDPGLPVTGAIGATVAGGLQNEARADTASIGGGEQNRAEALSSTVGGGYMNRTSGVSSTVGGGEYNLAVGFGSTVGGGARYAGAEQNVAHGAFATVGGGSGNLAGALGAGPEDDLYPTVGGGRNNTAQRQGATVAGGESNKVWAPYGVVGGGGPDVVAGYNRGNWVHDAYGAILGGTLNEAGDPDTPAGDEEIYAAVVGGLDNHAAESFSFVGGGEENWAVGDHSSVSGGYLNLAGHELSAIVGGSMNGTSGAYGFIGGGNGNGISGMYGAIGGGHLNECAGTNCSVGGGGGNHANGISSVVAGGNTNSALETYAAVLGGFQNVASGDKAVVGGGDSNQATATQAAALSGYNNSATALSAVVVGGSSNSASGNFAFVAGGLLNSGIGSFAAIGGGENNSAVSGHVAISGGSGNVASADFAAVGGGFNNSAAALHATVAGGVANQAIGISSSVGGGNLNLAGGDGSTIAGGLGNEAPGTGATIGGGVGNLAVGENSAIPGGRLNVTGCRNCLAAGSYAHAVHEGSFVWSEDTTPTYVRSPTEWTFSVQALNGIWLGTDRLPSIPAGVFLNTSTGAYLSATGDWVNSSDRNRKEAFEPVDPVAVLAAVRELPITTWTYKDDSTRARHLGPMAQDFKALFRVGREETSISTIDAAGVALAAIQALAQTTEELASRARELERALATVEALERRLTALEAAQGRP